MTALSAVAIILLHVAASTLTETRESAPGICPPRGTSTAEVDDVMARYLRLHQPTLRIKKRQVMIAALRQAYPCRKIANARDAESTVRYI